MLAALSEANESKELRLLLAISTQQEKEYPKSRFWDVG
jgi:hypothetical protein